MTYTCRARHNSPNFGKHYTAEEVIDLFAPSQQTVDAVQAWLASAGIHQATQSVNKQWMQFDIAVEDLEELLKTTYYEYEHLEAYVTHIACEE